MLSFTFLNACLMEPALCCLDIESGGLDKYFCINFTIQALK